MPAGITLSAKHINTLKVWGVIEADIVGAGKAEDNRKKLEELPPELVQQTMQHTRARFRHADAKHPAVRNLAKMSLSRVANALYFTNNWQRAFTPPDPPLNRGIDSLHCPDLAAIVENDIQLASLPEVFHQVMKAINDPRTSASHIADVVSKDTSLSAKLLRIVNSPFYGFAEKVDTLSRALAMVGTDKLANLALGISAVNAFKDIDEKLFDMREFWEHSILCALAASWIASQKDEQEEAAFLGGLLHDIGWLIMLKIYPDQAREALVRIKEDDRPGYLVEREVWGFDHAELGGMALREWQFPNSLVSGVMHHHMPQMVKYEFAPSLIHVSDFASHALNTRVDFEPIPPLRSGAWETLGLTHNVFAPMSAQIDAQIKEIMGVFFGD